MKRQAKNESLGKIFRDSLLVWLRQGALTTALAGPPFILPENVRIVSASGPLLKIKRGRRAAGNLIEWSKLGLHGKPNPFLAFVLEGPVDLSVGVTERMARESNVSDAHGVYQLRLPQQSVLIYPANVPTTDGIKPHWAESDSAPLPDSVILWVDIMAEGAILHTCHTRSRSHTVGLSAFVFDTHLLSLTNLLIEELQKPPVSRSAEITREMACSLLQVLLLRIARSLQTDAHPINAGILSHITGQKVFATRTADVRRACDFIEEHLSRPLTVGKIADRAFVSPAQLNRLFRAELGCSVMQYVNEQRLERAKSLLINTTLSVGTISSHLGIRNVVYFCRLFRHKTGMTPLQFRFSKTEKIV